MIKSIGPESAAYIAEHQDMYPEAMRETEPEDWARLLASTPYSFGYLMDDPFGNVTSDNARLLGWRIFKRELYHLVYAYDLSVLPEFQHRGIARQLVVASLRKLRWQGESVHSHLRETSYHLVADPKLIAEAGYRIVSDIFIPDHYFGEYGIHEDAHELYIAPVGG